MEKWVTRNTIFDGRIFRVVTGDVELDDGTPAYREVVEHPGGVCVLPYDGTKVTLVRQYRIALGEYLLEAPAGKLEPGDEPASRAATELREETGIHDATLIDVGVTYGTVGFCSEHIHLFLALQPTFGEAQPEHEERIEIVNIALEDALERVRDNSLRDAKTIVLLHKLQAYLQA